MLIRGCVLVHTGRFLGTEDAEQADLAFEPYRKIYRFWIFVLFFFVCVCVCVCLFRVLLFE